MWLLWEIGAMAILMPELSAFLDDDEATDNGSMRFFAKMTLIDQKTRQDGAMDDLVLMTALFYDPLVAKISIRGRTRAEAVGRLRRALAELRIAGIETSAPLLRRLVESPEFEAGDFHIHFLEPFSKRVMAERPRVGGRRLATRRVRPRPSYPANVLASSRLSR